MKKSKQGHNVISQLGLNLIEKAVNTYLFLDPEISKRLDPMNGKAVSIEIQETPIKCFVKVSKNGLHFYADYHGKIDTFISGSFSSFMKMTAPEDILAKKKGFPTGIDVRGDMEFGQEMRKLFEEIDIDW